ncbi:hypothetical protein [Natronospira bacteriovora]|uniref:Uncharacterized protein n=1 Tax=Natronospira bacteriovora TaxID=3069753 RepID=A0ABU0W4P4_9GAMM|nr:hypothetical protein [Natronospira sp. AB-CW4]MDQ2068990.1 hypothetical protein [Natronospira sp. AB-CW4]
MITGAALTGGERRWKIIDLPLDGSLTLDDGDLEAGLRAFIRAWRAANPGHCPMFGRVLGFRYYHSPDQYWVLGLEGRFTGLRRHQAPARMSFSVGGRAHRPVSIG